MENAQTIDDNQIFVESLALLSENDIELNDAAKNASKPTIDFVWIITVFICGAVFIYSAFFMIKHIISYFQAAKEFRVMQLTR